MRRRGSAVALRRLGPLAGLAAVLTLAPSVASAATIDVTTNADTVANDAQCSLREAVTSSNQDAANPTDCTDGDAALTDTIQLDPATTYDLTGTINESQNAGGDLNVEPGTNGVTIEGAGAASTTIDSDVADRVIRVVSGEAELRGLTITGGNVPGDAGGLYVDTGSTVSLDDSIVTANQALTGTGGGIIVVTGATLTVTDSTISDNDAAFGAGIQSSGDLDLDGSTVSGNDASQQGGGILTQGGSGSFSFTDGSLTGNSVTSADDTVSASPRGGGLYLNQTTATIADSTISGNVATVTDPDASPFGGGIYVAFGTATITGSTLSTNTTSGGTNGNSGGAIFNASLTTLTLRNSTFSGNSAVSGGALYNGFGDATLNHTTLTGNTGTTGAAIAHEAGGGSGSTTIRGTLIANGATACVAISSPDPITSDGYNIDQGSSCGLNGTGDSQNVANPMLGGLTNNGGLTETHALLAGSPAINHVPNAECDDENGTPLTVDQRGFTRPRPPAGACDAGAFELQPPAPPTFTSTNPPSGSDGNNPLILGAAAAATTVDLYANATCTGAPAVSGTAAAFASPGLQVSVADNSTTTFYGTAQNAAGTSACSSGAAGSITYSEVTPAPITPVVPVTTPAATENPECAVLRAKLKKAKTKKKKRKIRRRLRALGC